MEVTTTICDWTGTEAAHFSIGIKLLYRDENEGKQADAFHMHSRPAFGCVVRVFLQNVK